MPFGLLHPYGWWWEFRAVALEFQGLRLRAWSLDIRAEDFRALRLPLIVNLPTVRLGSADPQPQIKDTNTQMSHSLNS